MRTPLLWQNCNYTGQTTPERAQRSLQMQHPPYELLVPRNVDDQLKELGRIFKSHNASKQQIWKQFNTNRWLCYWKCSRHLWISTFALTETVVPFTQLFQIHSTGSLDSHQSQITCKKAKPSHFIFGVLHFYVAPKKLHCSGSQSSKKSYIQLTFSCWFSPKILSHSLGRTPFCTDMSLTSLPFARLLNLLYLGHVSKQYFRCV